MCLVPERCQHRSVRVANQWNVASSRVHGCSVTKEWDVVSKILHWANPLGAGDSVEDGVVQKDVTIAQYGLTKQWMFLQ